MARGSAIAGLCHRSPAGGNPMPLIVPASAESTWSSWLPESRADESQLLSPVSGRVALGGARSFRPRDVDERDLRREEVADLARRRLARTHVARLFLGPDHRLQSRVPGDQPAQLIAGERVEKLDPGNRDVGRLCAPR